MLSKTSLDFIRYQLSNKPITDNSFSVDRFGQIDSGSIRITTMYFQNRQGF